jgi:predicted acyl esterase
MPAQTRDISSIDTESFAYIFEQNVTINLQHSTGLIRCNVYRPKEQGKCPALVTYGPYGKDIPYKE